MSQFKDFVNNNTTIYESPHHLYQLNDSNQSSECHPLDQVHPEQLYVNLSTFWYCFLAFITTLGLIISLISNMIIIYLFSSTNSLRKNPSNIIAVNLSLSDLLYCIQWPSVIYSCLTQSTWILENNPFVCQSFGFITVSTALASILTVLVMSVERAVVIIYSIQAKNKFTIRSARYIIIIIWLVSLISGLPPLFGKFNRYTLDPSKTSCTLDYLSRQADYKLYILVLYVAYWIVPTIIITISYVAIIVTFKKSSLSLKTINRESKPGSMVSSTKSIGRHKVQDSLHLSSFLASCRGRISIESEEMKLRRVSFGQTPGSDEKNRLNTSNIAMITNKKNQLFRRASSSSIPTIDRCASKNESGTSCSFKSGLLKTRPKFSAILARDSTRIHKQRQQSAPCQDTNIDHQLKTTHLGSEKMQNVITPSSSVANSQLTRTVLQFRLAKMSFYLILLWLVSWTPIASLAMINSVVRCHHASATAVFLASTMTKLGPAFDVFIYGISHPKIKIKFKKIVRWMLMMDSRSETDNCPREASVPRVNIT